MRWRDCMAHLGDMKKHRQDQVSRESGVPGATEDFADAVDQQRALRDHIIASQVGPRGRTV